MTFPFDWNPWALYGNGGGGNGWAPPWTPPGNGNGWNGWAPTPYQAPPDPSSMPEAHQAFLASLRRDIELPTRPGSRPDRNMADLETPRKGRRIFDVTLRENGGKSRYMVPGVDDFQTIDLLNVQAPDPSAPELVTLAFEPQVLGADSDRATELWPVGTDCLLYLAIEWGAGKGTQHAILDLREGTRVSLEASSIIASVLFFTSAGLDVRVSCSGAYGAIANLTNTCTFGPFTVPPGEDAPGRSDPILVPRYARGVTVLSNDDPNAAAQVSELALLRQNTSSAVVAQRVPLFGSQVLGGSPSPRITLPNGIRAIAFVNASEAPIEYTAVFDLAI